MKWWKDEKNILKEIQNSERSGITYLYGREINNQWEYAIVNWHYMSATIMAKFKNGTVEEDE